MDTIVERTNADLKSGYVVTQEMSEKIYVIPPNRTRYLSEITENNRNYNNWVEKQAEVAEKLYAINKTMDTMKSSVNADILKVLQAEFDRVKLELDPKNWLLIDQWEAKRQSYKDEFFIFKVRDKELKIATHSVSLSQSRIPKVVTPSYKNWGSILRWSLTENVPGEFPFAAGIYPFKREGEDPTRMFAGEGGPERTNRRFHYVSKGMPAARLSTAFDSVTLYGNDPDLRPDIYGKIGNAGVSICCLDDAKKLYSGFDLSHPMTSVSMTINGPAPMLLGFFMNAAIDQN
jgi:methylmalonyl-CoA mutase